MSWRNFLIFSILALLIVGCSGPKPKYEQEDFYFMSAVDSFERRDFNSSSRYFRHLYEKTDKQRYLVSFLDSLLLWGAVEELETEARKLIDEDDELVIPRRFLVLSLYQQQRDDEAIKEGEKVLTLTKEKESRDYIILADLYLKKNSFEKALLYFQSAYGIVEDKLLVDKIAYLLFEKLDRKKEAVAYLETHLRVNGYDLYLSQRLSDYYLKMGDVKSIINVYKKIYNNSQDAIVGGKIVELYLLRKNYDGLTEFLEKTQFNNKMLFEVYKLRRDYKNAARVAFIVYKESMDVKYLAQNAMISFEEIVNKDSKLIKSTIKKLEEVVKTNENPIYLNYLGYLLIEYNIDIKKGIKLVQRALLKDSDNLFYIDSLAWGEYKLKRYQKAFDLMQRVKESLGKDKTVKMHFEEIKDACKKNKNCKVY